MKWLDKILGPSVKTTNDEIIKIIKESIADTDKLINSVEQFNKLSQYGLVGVWQLTSEAKPISHRGIIVYCPARACIFKFGYYDDKVKVFCFDRFINIPENEIEYWGYVNPPTKQEN